jgi:hypothetical protein
LVFWTQFDPKKEIKLHTFLKINWSKNKNSLVNSLIKYFFTFEFFYFNMQFFYEDGHGSMMNEEGKGATSIIEEKSFRLKSLTDLRKSIKNQKLQLEVNECDVVIEDP